MRLNKLPEVPDVMFSLSSHINRQVQLLCQRKRNRLSLFFNVSDHNPRETSRKKTMRPFLFQLCCYIWPQELLQLWERPQGKGQEERLTSLSFKLFWHRHFVTHKCTFTAINWSNSNTFGLCFHASPFFLISPMSRLSGSGARERGGGGGCLQCVWV